MSRLIGPKAKLCRNYGVNLFGSGKYDRILIKKPHPAGMHGAKQLGKRGKVSQYGSQLKAKQVCALVYGGIKEKQFRLYVEKGVSMVGDSSENLLKLLECRADTVIFRSGIAETIFQARQMINHGHFCVNDKKIMTASIQLKPGDVIKVIDHKRKLKLYEAITGTKEKIEKIKSWLKVDFKTLSVTVQEYPNKDHFDPIINPKAIIEFYSR